MARAPRDPSKSKLPDTAGEKPARQKPGPKAHEPTAQTRLDVLVALIRGSTQAECLEVLAAGGTRMGVTSFQTHYAQEISLAAVGEEKALHTSVLRRALNPNSRDGLDAAKFILARRHKWTEVQKHEHAGRDGKPIEHRDLTGYSDDELAALERARAILDGELPLDPVARGDPSGEEPPFV